MSYYPPPQQPGYGAPQGQYPPPQQPHGYPPQQPPPGAYPSQYAYQPPQNDPARAWFDAVDRDRSGSIDATELQAALSHGGMQFSHATTEKMIRMFDRDGSNSIQFMEFQQLNGFIQQMSAGFRARDTDGSGTLEGHEVRAALAASGYQLSEPVFQAMMRKFDPERHGGLKFDDYIGVSILLGNARNVFARHDVYRNGQATFNFDSFLGACVMML